MTTQLSGTAFITGAGSGIGQAAAIALAQHGVTKLALADIQLDSLRDTVAQLEAISGSIKTISMQMDVAREEDVVRGIRETVSAFGSLDYAVNNAGVGGPIVPTGEMGLGEWQRCIDINLNVRHVAYSRNERIKAE